MALKENWSNLEMEALVNIALNAFEKKNCVIFKDAAQLADCAGIRLFSKQAHMFFDPKYKNRYSQLGVAFKSYMTMLSASHWTPLRNTLANELFGLALPMWSKCDNTTFLDKTSVLDGLILGIVKENAPDKIAEFEKLIGETIKNCQ